MGWARANDQLTGSSYARAWLDAFDENGDGIIDYEEKGREGTTDFFLYGAAYDNHVTARVAHGRWLGYFLFHSNMLRWSNVELNVEKRDFLKHHQETSAVAMGMALSRMEIEAPDPIFPSMTWGKGKWPSIQAAVYLTTGMAIYGRGFPSRMTTDSLYGVAFRYASTMHRASNPAGRRWPTAQEPPGIRPGGRDRGRHPSVHPLRAAGLRPAIWQARAQRRRDARPRKGPARRVRRRRRGLVTFSSSGAAISRLL